MTPPQATIVIPVFNEEAILESNLTQLAAHFDRIVGRGQWRALVVDNNSADESARIIDAVSAEIPSISRLHQPFPDFGRAVARGLGACQSPYAYVLSIDEWDVPFIAWAWLNRESYDLFVGSKRADPAINQQAPYRRLLSWGLNLLLKVFFGFTGTDTHGPKMMRMQALKPVLDGCVMGRGQYDTEFVLKSRRTGLRVVEVPVAYAEQRPTRNTMFAKIARNVRDLFRLHGAMKDVPQGAARVSSVTRDEVMSQTKEFIACD